jgi:twinkle protein
METMTAPVLDWLESRSIWSDTAARFGVYTANVTGLNRSPVVVFPYMENGVRVNEKFRQLPKQKFWQQQGRRKIFWNADVLRDPVLEAGTAPLIITEGEIDAMTAIQCGFPFTVSVPDGAPPEGAISGRADRLEESCAEQTGKFEFMWAARDQLRRIKRFVLAVDDDGPGRCLAEHLVRRLSASRCSFVEYPIGCKDLNDVLVKKGPEAVTEVLNAAKPYPVRGLYRLSDYPDASFDTYSTGWTTLDRHFRLFVGEFIVVTGIPGHGKSSWVLHLIANLAQVHGMRTAIFSPEMPVVPAIRDQLRCIKAHRAIEAAVTPENDAWIEDNFVFIGPDPRKMGEDDDFTLDWIIDRAEEAVLRDGVRILLIDPWNEIEHARVKGETMTDYVSRSIRALKKFAKLYNMIVVVVAHPTKLSKEKDGSYAVPSLYDIADSAHFNNKPDHGVVIYREADDSTSIWVSKVRFNETGERGRVKMKFDRLTRRFELLDA